METHGVGLSLHVRMGDAACDLLRFSADKVFPAEVFGGPRRWNNEEALSHKRISPTAGHQNQPTRQWPSQIRVFARQ